MKRIVKVLFVCLLALVIANPVIVKADMGPKPSIVINFGEGFGEPYYVTLLTAVEGLGPFNQYDEEQEYSLGEGSLEVAKKFAEYAKNDEYYFLMNFDECSNDNTFTWGYMTPDSFKVLIYLPQSDKFIETEIYKKYAFDAYYKYDFTNNTLKKNYQLTSELISLVVRIVLTILVEVIIALMFGFKGRLKPIVITNIVTQLILNLFMSIMTFYAGMLGMALTIFIIELAVVIIEMIVYAIVYRKWKVVWYTIIANASSFIVGLELATIIPALF